MLAPCSRSMIELKNIDIAASVDISMVCEVTLGEFRNEGGGGGVGL